MHVERQTLHARLQRAFRIIGGDPSGTPAALSLHVALRLRTIQILGASRQRSTGL
ncbi:MAG: helix-turn-helix domain-containing protein [Nocardioidaceae bacterium]